MIKPKSRYQIIIANDDHNMPGAVEIMGISLNWREKKGRVYIGIAYRPHTHPHHSPDPYHLTHLHYPPDPPYPPDLPDPPNPE